MFLFSCLLSLFILFPVVWGMDMGALGDMGPEGMSVFQEGVAEIIRKHSSELFPKGTPFRKINGNVMLWLRTLNLADIEDWNLTDRNGWNFADILF